MLRLSLGASQKSPLRVLCLGAHSDDIEIGCGGTILRLLRERPGTQVHWVVFSSGPERDHEARRSAGLFLKGAKEPKVVIKDFRDSFFPSMASEIKDFFEQLKTEFVPEVIFTHHRNDLHQDHRTICELTWNTFRNHFILEYEIPKYDGDLGSPNVFVPLDRPICGRKVKHILDAFKTQRDKQWFTPETFLSLLRIRGVESKAPSGLAEAFYGRKVTL
jgi:LmbE family N-acetylglucosaminyl deacetylase